LFKNPECKKYIQYSENFQGKLCFQGKRKLLKNPVNGKKYFNTVIKFRANSVFQGKRKLFKFLNEKISDVTSGEARGQCLPYHDHEMWKTN